MKRKLSIALFLLVCLLTTVQAQQLNALKINEILVVNEDNFVDDYGKRHSWIEIYNSSPGSVNIAGCFLTNDPENPKMYMIPKGDVLTNIPPRQHVLFWADDKATHGTFHLNFTLDLEKENYIALFSSDGKTLLDEIVVPAGQQADISYGLVLDGWNQQKLDEYVGTAAPLGKDDDVWMYYTKVTPSANNKILDTNEKLEKLEKEDKDGFGMTLTAMLVVFSGLILLFFVFKLVGIVAVNLSHRRAMKASGMTKEEAIGATEQSGAVYAAIAMAIYEATELHDDENAILTIKSVQRNYSPWSSKIYTLRENPKR